MASSCILKNHMAGEFLSRIKQSPVLCDGAMGTLLYAKGIFINRSYDELNLSQPDLIRGIHHEYLQSGAEIIETNTFGGNAFRLGRHSLADKVRDINLTRSTARPRSRQELRCVGRGIGWPTGNQNRTAGQNFFPGSPRRFS